MKKEKKQLRELSEEALKKVTGGSIQLAEFGNLSGATVPSTPISRQIALTVDGTCPEGYSLVTTAESSICCPA